MGQSSSIQRDQRHHSTAEHLAAYQGRRSHTRDEEMNHGHNSEQAGDFEPLARQATNSSDVQMTQPGQMLPPFDSWQPPVIPSDDMSVDSSRVGNNQEEVGPQYDTSQRDYQSVILNRLARRQSTMSRLGSRILPNSVIRGLLNSEEETPAEGHAHRHGIVSRTIPRSEVNQSSTRFSPFASLSSRGSNRRRPLRGSYFSTRSDSAMNTNPSNPTAESSADTGMGSWRRSIRLRRVGHSLSNPIAHMFGQPSADLSPQQGVETSYPFNNPDSVGFIPHPGPIDTPMDFDSLNRPESMEPAVGDTQTSSPTRSSQSQSNTRHFPSLLRARPSRALRREEQTPLSRVLQLAATAIAAQLSGGAGPALPNIQALGNEGLDGSLESFIQSLQRATSGEPASGDPASSPQEERPSTPVNFMRVFRFANSDNTRSPTAPSRTERGLSSASPGDHMDTDNHTDSPEGRTVTLVVVGVRSVPSGNGSGGDQQPAALPGLDALLRLPFLTPGSLSPRIRSRAADTPRPVASSAPTTGDDVPPRPGMPNPSRRLSDAAPSRGTPSSLPSVISDSPPGPHPPPSTPAEPGLSAVSSGASTPSRRLSTTSAISPNILPQLSENPTAQPTVETTNDSLPPSASHQRRRSDSEFARHREQLGSGAARRNGVVEPDSHNAPTGRSWLIYVVGTNLSENHPAFAAPSLFTDNPTYEDMVLLSSLLGPVKPPVATQEDLTSAGGLFRLVEYGGKLSAEAIDGSGVIQIAEGERCLICLSEYEASEDLRQLAKCEHLYHRDCIDQWLTTGRNSCPLCRGQGVADKSGTEPPPSSDAPRAAAV